MKVSLQPPTASPSQKESKTSLLPELLSVIDERLRNSESIDTYMSGAVAVLLILTDTHAVVANIGDSRVIVGIQADSPAEWIPQQLTTCVRSPTLLCSFLFNTSHPSSHFCY